MGIVSCIVYVAFLGIISFLLGRILPKGWFSPTAFPYKLFKWERNGAIYDCLNIRKWQNLVPDMSKLFKRWMPPKKLNGLPNAEAIELMLQETCIAEFTHGWLSLAGLACLWLWPGLGGIVVTVLYIFVGNLPYILIQRYNRPRLTKLLNKIKSKHNNGRNL